MTGYRSLLFTLTHTSGLLFIERKQKDYSKDIV